MVSCMIDKDKFPDFSITWSSFLVHDWTKCTKKVLMTTQ